jgi:hypothetical protein
LTTLVTQRACGARQLLLWRMGGRRRREPPKTGGRRRREARAPRATVAARRRPRRRRCAAHVAAVCRRGGVATGRSPAVSPPACRPRSSSSLPGVSLPHACTRASRGRTHRLRAMSCTRASSRLVLAPCVSLLSRLRLGFPPSPCPLLTCNAPHACSPRCPKWQSYAKRLGLAKPGRGTRDATRQPQPRDDDRATFRSAACVGTLGSDCTPRTKPDDDHPARRSLAGVADDGSASGTEPDERPAPSLRRASHA